jgi:glucosamine--fructose-6-phosphate aminotransferase (isomerizing)
MCGIYGYIGSGKNAANIVYSGLKELEYRGYDSYGILLLDDSGNAIIRNGTGPLPKRKIKFQPSSTAFGHTRWATHGGVTIENAHPHSDCGKNIFVVHNGIIENDEMLREWLIKRGHTLRSDTDTELFAHLIEHFKKNNSFEVSVVKSFGKIHGLNAFVILDRKANQFISIKNTSPIIIGEMKNGYFISSDPNSLLPYTRKLFIQEDDTYCIIRPESAKVITITKNGKMKDVVFRHFSQKHVSESRGLHKYYTHKEICQQPAIILNYATRQDEIKKLAKIIQKSFGTYVIGCGSAGFAALYGTYIMSKYAHRHINFTFASEFPYNSEFITPRSLVIALSQSGETADIISAVKVAREKKARIMAITNTQGSSLYRLADDRFLLEAGQEKSVLSTKSFMA